MQNVTVRSERRKLRETERRKDIVRAAEALILRRGFGRLTMDGLAREAQFSKATLYQVFRSKTEVVAAIYLNYFDRIKERLERIRGGRLDHEATLRQFIRAVLVSHEESRNLSQALLLDETFMKKMGVIMADERRMSAEDRKFVGMMRSRLREITAYVADFLAEGMKRGVFRKADPVLTVMLLSAAINGFCHHQPWMPVTTSLDEAEKFLHDFFMRGLAPRGGSRQGETK
jgi:AcrR family transcriptional regulator